MLKRARIGLTNIMPTIIIGNMEMEFPTMYIMKRFIGIWNRNDKNNHLKQREIKWWILIRKVINIKYLSINIFTDLI